MSRKVEITICLGSSCFARGNKNTLKAIMKYLNDHNLNDSVYFHGGHCYGACAEGPNIKIDDAYYTGVDEFKVIDVLNGVFYKE
jgi:NADH:ubiquinone oxidoreductase subunit E